MGKVSAGARGVRGARVAAVYPGSAAFEAGLERGDVILRINGSPLKDIIDYKFLETDTCLKLEVAKRSGELWVIDIDKDYDEDIGVEFESATFDGVRTCRNKCVFCFIDQLPGGLRESLYVKDDDYRLSFLHGNFITLTNAATPDLERIVRMRLSPLYISVHATSPEIRARLLGNRHAGQIMEHISLLAQAGIEMHIQIVLCPGLNDGPVLDQTISDLAGFWPRVKSVGVVPVGLTRYRSGLYPLRPVTEPDARAVVDHVERRAAEFKRGLGYSLCFAADEFYLMAHRKLPATSSYEDFPQLENGIGLIRSFLDELDDLRGPSGGLHSSSHALRVPSWAHATHGGIDGVRGFKSILVVTGVLAQDIIGEAAIFIEESLPGLDMVVCPVQNRFFGDGVSVAGLVVGRDIIESLSTRPSVRVHGGHSGEQIACIAIPSVMLKSGEDSFLDGTNTGDIEAALNVPVRVIEPSPRALFELACDVMGTRAGLVR